MCLICVGVQPQLSVGEIILLSDDVRTDCLNQTNTKYTMSFFGISWYLTSLYNQIGGIILPCKVELNGHITDESDLDFYKLRIIRFEDAHCGCCHMPVLQWS